MYKIKHNVVKYLKRSELINHIVIEEPGAYFIFFLIKHTFKITHLLRNKSCSFSVSGMTQPGQTMGGGQETAKGKSTERSLLPTFSLVSHNPEGIFYICFRDNKLEMLKRKHFFFIYGNLPESRGATPLKHTSFATAVLFPSLKVELITCIYGFISFNDENVITTVI